MEVITNKTNLLQAVALPQSISQRKSTMPILQNVLFHSRDNYLYISASDLEVAAITRCEATIAKGGRVAINGKMLGEVVRELPEGQVSISVSESDQIELRAQKTRLRLPGINGAEFPALRGIDLDVTGHLKASELVQMLSQTLYATSQDETRYSLIGVLIESSGEGKNNTLKCVATDGHRLSVCVRPSKGFRLDTPVIVPRKALAEVRKSVELEGDRDIGISVSDNYFVIETSQAKVAIRVIDGEYPDYRMVIPKKTTISGLVSVDEFSRAIRRALLMAADDEHKVVFTFSPGTLRMESISKARGEATEEIELEGFEGEPFSIGFNPRYLLDLVTSFAGHNKLKISLPSAAGPGVFSPEDDEASFAIVMPMRVDD